MKILFACGLLCGALAGCDAPADSRGLNEGELNLATQLDECGADPTGVLARLCADGDYTALRSAVREVLVDESRAVSAAGAELLVRNEARWREAQRVACGFSEGAEPRDEQVACLEARMRARAADVRTAVEEIGGYVFQRMELIEAAPAADNSAIAGNETAAVVRDIRFPRIDSAQTPETRAFNDMVAQQPQFRLQDGANESVSYAIAYAGPQLISVRFTRSADRAGASGSVSLYTVNVLMREGRLLTEADLFQPQSGWERFLTERAVREISRQFNDPNFPPARDVYETATKPHLWVIGERGLTLLFPLLSFGGSHADGDTEVTFPWVDLRPYLNPTAPAPIGPSA